MRTRLSSLEQLMPLPRARELLAGTGRRLVSAVPGDALDTAVRLMRDHDIGFLPVLERGKLVGVLSERDIVRNLGLPERASVRDIMTTRVHTVAPSAKVPECLAVMHREHVRHLPVVSGAAIEGVLSMRDITGALIERHERLLRRLEHERLVLLSPNPGSY